MDLPPNGICCILRERNAKIEGISDRVDNRHQTEQLAKSSGVTEENREFASVWSRAPRCSFTWHSQLIRLNLFGALLFATHIQPKRLAAGSHNSLDVECLQGGRLAGSRLEFRTGKFIPTTTLLQFHCRSLPKDKLTIAKSVTAAETLPSEKSSVDAAAISENPARLQDEGHLGLLLQLTRRSG